MPYPTIKGIPDTDIYFRTVTTSIVFEEENYLLELVRYIHLNPARAGVAKTLDELDAYPYNGHSVIIRNIGHTWQDREYDHYRYWEDIWRHSFQCGKQIGCTFQRGDGV